MHHLSLGQLERFLQELASLMRAGLPVPEGLRQLSAHLNSRTLEVLSREVAESMEKGESLSTALGHATVRVPRELVAIMRCAEVSGDAGAIIESALEHARRLRVHRESLLNAAFYPILAACMMIVLAQFGSWTVLSDLQDVFKAIGVQPKGFQQAVWNAASLIASPGGVLLSLLAIAALVAPLLTESGHNRLLSVLSATPFVKPLVDLSDTALWLRFTGAMLRRGVPLHEALEAASIAVTAAPTRSALAEMATAAERGQRVGDRLPGATPSAAAYMFAQGESRGTLGASCPGIADYCEQKFNLMSRRAGQLLEPALLVVLGLFIMSYLYAWYVPLFDIPRYIGR